jgi:hypothetical protein
MQDGSARVSLRILWRITEENDVVSMDFTGRITAVFVYIDAEGRNRAAIERWLPIWFCWKRCCEK